MFVLISFLLRHHHHPQKYLNSGYLSQLTNPIAKELTCIYLAKYVHFKYTKDLYNPTAKDTGRQNEHEVSRGYE